MAIGSSPGENNPKASTNVPPVTGGKGSARAGPQTMRQMRPGASPKAKILMAAGVGVVGAFVFFKARAVMYRSEDAKRRTTYKKEGVSEAERRKDKSYHVTVERSGGGV